MFYQVFRAFFNIFDCVAGHSRAAARLRSQIWQSIFTHDLRRYRRSLYRSLHEVTTLVTGPSGSGKELVAQAIGRSRYIPFSVKERRFEASAVGSYIALNVSAFSANLIESELFGYIKGAFTGAEGNRAGWLETCGGCGTILLDEIGELPPMTQVKLLRVLQNRQYQRMGESKLREFHGKMVAATNRDLGQEIRKGTFREDLYYRLCADVVTTPALAEHLREDPATLGDLVRFITKRIAPDEHVQLTQEILQWIDQNLPPDYHWPGNIRELEQCARNIMIRNHYQPALPVSESTPVNAAEQLARQIHELELTADELLTQYSRIAYAKTGCYKHAAERLGLDRRTLRARVTPSS
jgi:transcriptional regulator with PAS, ATPase and Fis domain